ncbi:hypothetical protein VTN31DRAFT_30 [Thermomyces dupontii]|uniref:uncharacterized protein n=1 Tax=Talaromyces thermophilus TaxID=28565 RepID=UPI003743DBB1
MLDTICCATVICPSSFNPGTDRWGGTPCCTMHVFSVLVTPREQTSNSLALIKLVRTLRSICWRRCRRKVFERPAN